MNIILQHWAEGDLDELAQLSVENMRQYAESLGAEHRLLSGYPMGEDIAVPSQKLVMLSELWNSYDVVVMVDTDMFARTTENVFDASGIGLYSTYTEGVFRRLLRTHRGSSDKRYPFWGGAIWRLEKDVRQRFRRGWLDMDFEEFNRDFWDEGIMHQLAIRADYRAPSILPQRWCWCSYLPGAEDAAMIHIRSKTQPSGGMHAPKIENYRRLVECGVLS